MYSTQGVYTTVSLQSPPNVTVINYPIDTNVINNNNINDDNNNYIQTTTVSTTHNTSTNNSQNTTQIDYPINDNIINNTDSKLQSIEKCYNIPTNAELGSMTTNNCNVQSN